MSIFDRIKRKLPVVGGPEGDAPARAGAAPGHAHGHGASAPTWQPPQDEPDSPRGDRPVPEFLAEFVKSKPVVIFMKGTPAMPMCGFSANAAGILRTYGVEMAAFDVLSDPEVREGVKQFSQWPTLPQIYVGGEFVGGADILMQMHQSGELKEMIQQAVAAAQA